ncbi:MAG: hypothetical protein RIR51_1124 [Bacteroidota bacterium]
MIKKKYLLIQTAFLGDLVLITSVLEKLFHSDEKKEVHVLVRKGLETILSDYPYIDQLRVHVYDKKNKRKSWWALNKEFRAIGFDEVMVFQRFFGMGLLATTIGAKKVLGYKENPLSFLFHKRFIHGMGNGMHEIERNNQFFEDGEPALKPRLSAPQYASLSDLNYIFFAPGSVWETKRWPKDHWVELIKNSPEEWTWVMSGAGAEQILCDEIEKEIQGKNLINLAGKLSLNELNQVIGTAKLALVNDSGPLHIASAMNIPTIALFCSTSPKFGFTPLAEQSLILEYEGELTCKPCGKHGKKACPFSHFLCGNGIEVNRVRAEISRFLNA